MDKCLGWWALQVFWNFTSEQVQNHDKLVEYLEVCCHPGNSREIQIILMCWGLAHAYRAALFNTIWCFQGKGGENKPTSTAAVPAPTAAAVPAVGTAATPT